MPMVTEAYHGSVCVPTSTAGVGHVFTMEALIRVEGTC